MVYQDIFKYAKEFSLLSGSGVEDFADKLNSRYMVMLLWISCVVIGLKSYVFTGISCYIATSPDASNFHSYLTNYCWIHGTIPITYNDSVPTTRDGWYAYDNTKRIYYYQWIMLVLGLQSIMFYIPKCLWSLLQISLSQTETEEIMQQARKLGELKGEKKENLIRTITMAMDSLLRKKYIRSGDTSSGTEVSYTSTFSEDVSRLKRIFCHVSISGTSIPLVYGLIKLLFLANALLQLYIAQKFIGVDDYFFGFTILSNLLKRISWRETGLFPRVTFCYADGIQTLAAKQAYVAQCALPVNMLAEKVYIVLWFAFVVAILSTILSLISWIFRMVSQSSSTAFVYKYLRCQDDFRVADHLCHRYFITKYLRHDGMFILRMISNNTTRLVMVDLVKELYNHYRKIYYDKDINDYGRNGYHGIREPVPPYYNGHMCVPLTDASKYNNGTRETLPELSATAPMTEGDTLQKSMS